MNRQPNMSPITERNGELMRRGRIEVICGSMFSGKTEELIRRMKRAKFARQSVEIFKPAVDTRYSEEDVRALCNLLLLYKLKWQPKLHKMLGMH